MQVSEPEWSLVHQELDVEVLTLPSLQLIGGESASAIEKKQMTHLDPFD